jgi:hypothetical protein
MATGIELKISVFTIAAAVSVAAAIALAVLFL